MLTIIIIIEVSGSFIHNSLSSWDPRQCPNSRGVLFLGVPLQRDSSVVH